MTQNPLNLKAQSISSEQLNPNSMDSDNCKKIQNMNDACLFTSEELDELKIIYPGCKNDKSLNYYRELRTKLLKVANNENFVCMVSSISKGAGTSHVAVNLAASIALDHSKTALIIDCNSYSPHLHHYLKDENPLGLSNYLEQNTQEIEDIIYPSGIRRVRIIPTGIRTEYAAENFSSDKMKLFIDTVKKRYPDRFIILDTPPISLYVESQILASICDIAILVIRYGHTTASEVQTGIDLISSNKLAGVILNNE